MLDRYILFLLALYLVLLRLGPFLAVVVGAVVLRMWRCGSFVRCDCVACMFLLVGHARACLWWVGFLVCLVLLCVALLVPSCFLQSFLLLSLSLPQPVERTTTRQKGSGEDFLSCYSRGSTWAICCRLMFRILCLVIPS